MSTLHLSLFDTDNITIHEKKPLLDTFSAGNICNDNERRSLEKKYTPIINVTEDLNRQSVSYQLSKNSCLHNWLKYKEGFSSNLVSYYLSKANVKAGGTVLDPFIGSGTTALVAKNYGLTCIGFDILPTSKLAINVKNSIDFIKPNELKDFLDFFTSLIRPPSYNEHTPYIRITEDAYPIDTELDIAFYTENIGKSHFSNYIKSLANLCIMSCLEDVSYTAKDGQYLRWDYRSNKVVNANKKRVAKGLLPYKVILDKGNLPTLKECFIKKFESFLSDIITLQRANWYKANKSSIIFEQKSALYGLPLLKSDSIDCVITSPPYCNRYDYTRIYALELVYLGLNELTIRNLRQSLLCCTVENKSKIDQLHEFYRTNSLINRFDEIHDIILNCKVLHEINNALKHRLKIGDVNNKGVISLVKGYFDELAFIFYELYRLCKRGSKVIFVNDNVRFAGEVIPVDTISTFLAESIGFRTVGITTIKQNKGNSSQQMKKFGRVPLRKSITIWER